MSHPLSGKQNKTKEISPPGLAQQQAPIIIQLTSSATFIQIKQYSRTLETKGEIAIPITWIEETDILVPCQSPWIIHFLPVKKPGASESHESDSSRETGILGLKGVIFSLSLAEVNQPIFSLKWTVGGYSG